MSKKLQKELDKAYSEYCNKVQAIADKYQREYINPWLDKHGYTFVTGMGDFWIGNNENPKIDIDELPRYIRDILEAELEGMPSNSLGTIMGDHIWNVLIRAHVIMM